jgi:shikimate kinase
LHPNETVVDHTKGQNMGGITIVNNIDAKGADASVDMKIRAAMQQTSQQTVMTIQDLMRRRRFA